MAAVAMPMIAAASDTARLHGTVVDVRGAAIAGFPLRIAEEGSRGLELRTGRDGSFSALGLTPGTIVVTLEGATYERSRAVCRIDAGMSARVAFRALAGHGASAEACHIEPSTTDVYIVK